jgi:hypothetical protein
VLFAVVPDLTVTPYTLHRSFIGEAALTLWLLIVFPVSASETVSGFRLEEGFGLIAVT